LRRCSVNHELLHQIGDDGRQAPHHLAGEGGHHLLRRLARTGVVEWANTESPAGLRWSSPGDKGCGHRLSVWMSIGRHRVEMLCGERVRLKLQPATRRVSPLIPPGLCSHGTSLTGIVMVLVSAQRTTDPTILLIVCGIVAIGTDRLAKAIGAVHAAAVSLFQGPSQGQSVALAGTVGNASIRMEGTTVPNVPMRPSSPQHPILSLAVRTPGIPVSCIGPRFVGRYARRAVEGDIPGRRLEPGHGPIAARPLPAMVLQGGGIHREPHQRGSASVAGQQREHNGGLAVGVEVGPVHCHIDAAARSHHVRDPVA